MPFNLFHDLCPEIAERETRTITLMPDADSTLPPADYAFLELYCDEPGCDCRRVMFSVMSSSTRKVEAVIAWGWESLAYYKRWLGGMGPNMAKEMQGPCLNLMSKQSKFADALLDLACRVLLADPNYIERIKRHYALFRSKIGGNAGNANKLTKGPRRKDRKR